MAEMGINMVSYIMGMEDGYADGLGTVEIDSDAYVFTDPNEDGNIVVEEEGE